MSWGEFITLLSGLNAESPLGQIISIRKETDKETLKRFTREQHRIRNEWRNRIYKSLIENKDDARKQIKQFQEMMKRAFRK